MTTVNLLIACALDGMLGDPRWLPHPIRGIGWVIAWFDHMAQRWLSSPFIQKMVGIGLALGLPLLVYGLCWFVLAVAYDSDSRLGDLCWIVLAYTIIAARDLTSHVMAVAQALVQGSVEDARAAVSLIVGRDTEELSESDIIRASVETAAESTCDGVIAPLLYLLLGGPPLAMAYKTINTLDSMIGYRTSEHEHLGWASARLDDVVNWIPARISGILIVAAAAIWLKTGAQAWRIYLRDGGKHASPNSGWPEAAMAGSLSVQLGGMNYYKGVAIDRPFLGDPGPMLTYHHVQLAVELIWIVFGLAVLMAMLWLSV